jgi:hypothetical protein
MKKENDIQNRVITKISQEDIQKAEKNSKEMKKRSRFVFDKEKVKIIKKIKKIKEIKKITSLLSRFCLSISFIKIRS